MNLINNRTECTSEKMIQYSIYCTVHSVFTVFLFVLFAFLVVLSVDSYLVYKDIKHLILIFVYIGLIFSYIPLLKIRFNSVFNKKSQELAAVFGYSFKEDGFDVIEINGTKVVKYSEVLKMIVDKNLLYIYMNKKSAFIVDTKQFINGNVSDVIKLYEKGKSK